MVDQHFPPGWDEKRVQEVLAHYDNQTEDDEVSEIEASTSDGSATDFAAQDKNSSRFLDGYLTHTVHTGANILGLLELLFFVGCIWLAGEVSAVKVATWALIILGYFGTLIFDLCWRALQTETKWWVSLLSPNKGGCFCFLPIWLSLVGIAIAGVGMLLFRHN